MASLKEIRLSDLSEKAKPNILCSDGVCSPLERDIVTVGVGADVGTAFGLSGGYAGVADAEVHWQLDLAIGGGLEFGIKGPMKIKPAKNSEFQSGGNLFAESGLGSTMFVDYTMLGTKRFYGVTGYVNFYGEKDPNTQLIAASIGRDGVEKCVDKDGITDCPVEIITLLNSFCNDQSRCKDDEVETASLTLNVDAEPRFGGLDKEELDEAMFEARNIVSILKEDIKARALQSRLEDVQLLFSRLKDSNLNTALKNEVEQGISLKLQEVLEIVSNNTRFKEIDLARVEKLPEAQDITEAIAQLLTPLLANPGETAEQTAENTKEKFCNTAVGLRKAFNKYCGR